MTDEKRWGEPISPARQAELQEMLDAWHAPSADHGDRRSSFHGVQLTGADVGWLAEQSGRDATGRMPNLHLEGAVLREAHLESANFWQAHLEGADLTLTHPEGAQLVAAHLEGANLSGVHLEGADLTLAHLKDANLAWGHLEGANLIEAYLEGAYLADARLEGTNFTTAHLEDAFLSRAHLEGANLGDARLERANLSGASFDKTSHLNDAVLTGASFDQVTFDNTNLTVVNWSLVDILGDERTARDTKFSDGEPKTRDARLYQYRAAARANRVLAVALNAQGLTEDATRFAYRAKVLQRTVYRLQRKRGAYLFSLLLAALAGYGYRLWRIFLAYGLIVTVFAVGYFASGGSVTSSASTGAGTVQAALDAFQISLNAIHGRVFFAQFGLDTFQSWLATIESVLGIVIEGTFVAMLIQRFFG
jgi:uncharacterized protein YjbI with pentapeptide repeats